MKTKALKLLSVILAIALCITFGSVLSIYIKPMENASLNLSLVPEGEGTFEEDFDEKGWEVYTQEGKTKTPLISNVAGGYTGIELGETFYFSRVLKEEMNSPTLQIDPRDCTISVFLDNNLLYTDCPEEDNRIGYLALHTYEFPREEPVIISLPRDYQGKTLTIAQAMPEYCDAKTVFALPSDVLMYSGYFYESELIAESFATAIAAALAFAVGLILLVAFVLNRNVGTLCTALVSFFWMTSLLFETSFLYSYFEPSIYDIPGICRMLSALALLIFLTTRAGRFKKAMWIVVGVYGASLIGYGAVMYFEPQTVDTLLSFFRGLLSEWLVCIALLTILVLGIVFWRKESRFYRLFAPLTLVAIIIYLAILLITDPNAVRDCTSSLRSGHITYIYFRLLPLVTVCAIFCAIVEAVQNYADRHTETRLLKDQHKLALESYENLRNHHQEVMMLRHDMSKHFHTLREMSNEEQTKSYLDELIGQNEKIRPVVQCGNEILDIILNGKLNVAMDSGIKVELIKTEAPEKLPLSNADLCSLIMNIIDNAVIGAVNSHTAEPYICLDIHEKNNYFAFSCENSANVEKMKKEGKKETVPKHGLGLKIIQNITARYDGLIKTEYGKNTYKVNVIIPLH